MSEDLPGYKTMPSGGVTCLRRELPQYAITCQTISGSKLVQSIGLFGALGSGPVIAGQSLTGIGIQGGTIVDFKADDSNLTLSLPATQTSAPDVTLGFGGLQAYRVSGPFIVRGQSSVYAIKDGWIVKGEDGYLRGYEDVDFQLIFRVAPSDFTDQLQALTRMVVGTPLVSYPLPAPASGDGGATLTTAALYFGTLPVGLAFAFTGGAAKITGTPQAGEENTGVYVEVLFTWSDGTTAIGRYSFAITA